MLLLFSDREPVLGCGARLLHGVLVCLEAQHDLVAQAHAPLQGLAHGNDLLRLGGLGRRERNLAAKSDSE